MKLYFAAPLFTSAEREWNATIAQGLREAGHEVFLPQEQEAGADAAGIFSRDVSGIDEADVLVAVMDGADADAGTAWEVGHTFGKKPTVLVRTDIRAARDHDFDYNAMLTQSATVRLDLPAASSSEVVTALLEALKRTQAAWRPDRLAT